MHVNRRALENLSNLGVIFVGALSCLIQCSLSVFISQVRISSSLKQHFHNLNENELKMDIFVSVRETHIRSAKRRRVMEAATLVTLVHISPLKFETGMKQYSILYGRNSGHKPCRKDTEPFPVNQKPTPSYTTSVPHRP